MPSTTSTFMMVILLVTTASANQSLRRAKRQGEDQLPSTPTTCPQLIPGPPGTPGGLSYSEAKELKQDIKEELQETLAEWIKNQSRPLGLSQCTPTLGKEPHTPAKSCRDIMDCDPLAPSGMYWLQMPNIVKKVFCDLETYHCGTTGWTRVAYINMTHPQAVCPVPMRQINSPRKLCGRSNSGGGCTSVVFPTYSFPYKHVCGQARGYQYYSTDAFKPTTNDINSHYVDGVSITYGHPRHHLWTYAAGLSDDYNHGGGVYNCPCAKYPGTAPPAFVGLDYYCESGITGRWQDNRRIALEDPLWDGDGCGPGNTCCAQAGMPWFCRTLPREVSEDIEVRICADGDRDADEDTYLEILEIFVQ